MSYLLINTGRREDIRLADGRRAVFLKAKGFRRLRRPLWWLTPPPSRPLRGGTMGTGQWRQLGFTAAVERKPYDRASPEENKQTALTGDGNAPLLPPAAAFPPEGEILAPLCIEMFMSLEAERRENFPLRGKWCDSTQRGCARHGCNLMGESPKCGMTITSTQPMARGPS